MAPEARVYRSEVSPAVRGRTPAVDQFFVSGEDNLRVTVFHKYAFTPRVEIVWRLWLEADGTVQVNTTTLNTATYPTAAVGLVKLDRGVLLNVQIAIPAGTFVRQGTLYARAEIIRGFTGGVQSLAMIAGGYVASQSPLAWPGTPIHGMHDGRGVLLSQTWTAGSAPLSLSLIVPEAVRWRFVSGAAVLVTSAVVADRSLALDVLDGGGNFLFRSNSVSVFPASSSIRMNFGAGLPHGPVISGFARQFSFPNDLELPESAEVFVSVGNEQAGDTFTGDRALVHEWMDR